MQAYRTEAKVAADGSLRITHLPLPSGQAVEVIILVQEMLPKTYSLRGQKVIYIEPFEPVAEDDWSATT
jgi:hypothetical protein